MFVSNDQNIVLEQYAPPQDPSYQDQGPEAGPEVEFENIKLFILYNKYTFLKNKIKLYKEVETDEDRVEVLGQMYNLMDMIQMYFNTMTYPQLVSLLDNISTTIGDLYHIKTEPVVTSDSAVQQEEQPSEQPETADQTQQ